MKYFKKIDAEVVFGKTSDSHAKRDVDGLMKCGTTREKFTFLTAWDMIS